MKQLQFIEKTKIEITQAERDFLIKLKIGEENAKTRAELYMDARTTRLLTASLRSKGVPICSGDSGYWIAKNQQEIRKTTARLKATAYEILKIVNCLERAEV